MKVALLNDKLDAGGAEKVIVNMANLLYANGVEVMVVLFLKPAVLDSLINPQIPVVYLHRKGRFDLKSMLLLKKMVKGFDIVHVHSRYNLRYYMVAKWSTGILKPKTIFHEHIPVLKMDAFTKVILRNADAYLAVLQSMCSWAKEVVHLKATRVFYLPNTINSPIRIIPQQPAGNKIIMVGNVWHFKNQLFAIDLIKALPDEYTLDIYGAINNESYHLQLINKINESKLSERIKIIQGVSDVYSILGKYNLAIHTSQNETGPLVLLEYMHAGLPFITYKTGDVVANIQKLIPECIKDTFEVDIWTRAIQTISKDDNARLNIRQKMRSIIKHQYSEDSYFKQLDGIYQVILN